MKKRNRLGVTFGIAILHPNSVGRITLASADPHDRPVLDFPMLDNNKDMTAMQAGLCNYS